MTGFEVACAVIVTFVFVAVIGGLVADRILPEAEK